jgi:hypothetical protein
MNFHHKSIVPGKTTAFRASKTSHISQDLENRLATFALGYGAVSVRFEFVGGIPTLVALSEDGIESRTALSGTAAGWHRALDEMASLCDDDA